MPTRCTRIGLLHILCVCVCVCVCARRCTYEYYSARSSLGSPLWQVTILAHCDNNSMKCYGMLCACYGCRNRSVCLCPSGKLNLVSSAEVFPTRLSSYFFLMTTRTLTHTYAHTYSYLNVCWFWWHSLCCLLACGRSYLIR